MSNFELMEKLRNRPAGRPAMYQGWKKLLFLHWKFDVETVQKTLPKGLFVDSHDGNAWVGIVPFMMRNIHPWWFPSVPGVSNFLEVNLRTYVRDANGIPGVWFYALAANQRLAATWGNKVFHLPYYYTKLNVDVSEDNNSFEYSMSNSGKPDGFESEFHWTNQGMPKIAEKESLDFFLFERYLMYNQTGPEQFRKGIVWHTPYERQNVDLKKFDDNMLKLAGLEPTGRPPDHVAFSPGVDTQVFPLQNEITFDS